MKPKYRPQHKQKIPAAFTAYLLRGIREIRETATAKPDLNRPGTEETHHANEKV